MRWQESSAAKDLFFHEKKSKYLFFSFPFLFLEECYHLFKKLLRLSLLQIDEKFNIQEIVASSTLKLLLNAQLFKGSPLTWKSQ